MAENSCKFSFSQHVHSASTAERVLTEASIQELLLLGSDLLVELVDLYLDDASERVRITVESFTAGDSAGVERAAHALKSSSANMGALPFSGVCGELERLGNQENLASMEPWIERLDSMHLEVTLALTALRAVYLN
jgi:HPt (histidine-containing phosphotransfer) domain-containing protein